ncbi:phosphonate metabolism transcriptional regulator PhnF [Phyllobacterium sophorae]|uniref:Phosphonate metabolism transcriptional regulator PhnF n=1 Tax=Phyllobacterium sophorae TaxID=1520277 RepID=A0A2P7B2W4_9HYPH|nr:phosphonate metabolism transcriptional regulator PhnF [Phyllobacterium sophorae]PSH60813.1 phosphonate metabolism transcriptional regulator PhnF [Phyllobacterium sophorae]
MLNETNHELTNELPRWRQIELTIMQEIDAGAYRIGERLPGENILAPQFGVTRTTVRRALSELQNKGVLRIEHGRGAFVERRVNYGLGAGSSFKANLRDASLEPAVEILAKFEVAASPNIANRLQIPVGEPVLIIDTVGKASDLTISVARHHLPLRLFPNALERISTFSCITEIYLLFGYEHTRRAHCHIEARLPSPEEARRLEQSKTEPILEVQSVKKVDQTPIDYSVARYSAGRVSVYFDN